MPTKENHCSRKKSTIGVMAFYMLSCTVLNSLNWQIEKIDGAHIVRSY